MRTPPFWCLFFVLKVGIDITLTAVKEFTDTAPGRAVIEEIETCALKTTGVRGVHDLKVRTAGGLYQMELHIVVDGQITVTQGHGIAKAVESCLLEEIKNSDRIIIHVDPGPCPKFRTSPDPGPGLLTGSLPDSRSMPMSNAAGQMIIDGHTHAWLPEDLATLKKGAALFDAGYASGQPP